MLAKVLSALAVTAVALTFAGAAQAAAPPYRTDNQAGRYITKQLPAWAGVDLHPPANQPDEYGIARDLPEPTGYCFGYGRDKRNRSGEDAYHAFRCTLSAYQDSDGDGQLTYDDTERTFHLRVLTRPHGRWVVTADR